MSRYILSDTCRYANIKCFSVLNSVYQSALYFTLCAFLLLFFFFFFFGQGQFSINLAGTGLRLSSTARWIAQGNYATADIHKSHVSRCCFPLPAPMAWNIMPQEREVMTL